MIALEDVEPIVDRAAELLHGELGLRPDPAMVSRLRRCLRDGAAEGDQLPAAYLDTLVSDRVARQHLFDRVTVQETSFFRHPGQFEALARHVLPGLAGPVTIWSAGCANGQEAYSLAMLLDEGGIPGRVIATDVSTRALQRTSDARYLARELTGLSEARRTRHLAGGPEWEIQPAIRDRVSVRHHNLVTDALPDHLAHCQVVFCRNVLIYFSPEHARAFLTRLAGQLAPGALLFLGYAETIWQVSDLFEPVRIGDTFEYFRRADQTEAAGRPASERTGADGRTRPERTGAGGRTRPERTGAGGWPASDPTGAGGPPASDRAGAGGPPASDRTAAGGSPASDRTGAAGRPRRTLGRSGRPALPAPGGRRRAAPVAPSAANSPQQGVDLARIGQAAAADRDYPAAIAAFRKCVYLAPDAPIAHLHLGLALEAAGDLTSAHRAFDAARAALSHCDPTQMLADLGGYRVEELLGLLDSRQEHPCP